MHIVHKTTELGCKHAELISYKVHKDQFKTLLVPNRGGVTTKGKSSGVSKKDAFDLLKEKNGKTRQLSLSLGSCDDNTNASDQY